MKTSQLAKEVLEVIGSMPHDNPKLNRLRRRCQEIVKPPEEKPRQRGEGDPQF